ncbi:uncharacterized protein LOC141652582 [Silene latifolia]|uniref:uncharacterized protein LOC141652582 n=1 Tax=Silene latifolia TaxID=37657 RepID=UPI003D7825D8
MAIGSLNRLSTHLTRTRTHFTPTLTHLLTRTSTTTATATATEPTTRPTTAKVSDRIINLSAIDYDGNKREIIGLTGHTLLKALTNHGLIDPASHRLEDIDACSAECEVHIAQEWLQKLPPASYDEQYVLTRNQRNRVLNKHARLGCQVVLTDDLKGMVVALPEPKAWDTP